MHHQTVNGEYVRIFVRGLGQQPKLRVVRHNFPDQNGHVPHLRPILLPSFTLGWHLYDQALELDLPDLPRLPEQSQNAGLGGEFAN